MEHKTLEFFDKNGNNLNFVLDSNDVWRGKLFIPTASAGLYEVNNIFIYDKVYVSGELHLCKPQSLITNRDKFIFKTYYSSITEGDNAIKLYELSEDGSHVNNVNIIELDSDIVNFHTPITNNTKVSTNINPEPIKIPIAGYSTSEGEYNTTFKIDLYNDTYETTKTIAEIDVYLEVEGEDERLNILLDNFNQDFHQSEYKLFSEVDPNEANPDWRILNPKRKEALLQIEQLKNFEMSYEGLLNAISYYGYTLGIKEYWKNIDKTSDKFGEYKLVEAIDELTGKITEEYINNTINVPNKVYKKTNFISLVYAINRIEENKFDIENLPLTKEISKFSIEEVLVKLFCLKRKLSLKYLPLQIKILDIVAEGDFFGSLNMSANTLQHKIDEVDVAITPEVEITNVTDNFIQDLRPQLFDISSDISLMENQKIIVSQLPSTPILDFENDDKFDLFNVIRQIKTGKINDIINDNFTKFKETFINYFTKNGILDEYDNNEFIPCGSYKELKITNFSELTINQYDGTTIAEFDSMFTVDNLKYGLFYEIEWIITRVKDNTELEYEYIKRGSIGTLSTLKLILPYSGTYNLEVKIYDLHNNVSRKIQPNFLTIDNLNSDMIGLYKSEYKEVTINDLSDTIIDNARGTMGRPYVGNATINDLNISIDSFNQANYSYQGVYNELDNFTIDNLKNARVDDLQHLTVENTRFAKHTDWVTVDDLNYPIDALNGLTLNEFTLNKLYFDLPTSFYIFRLNGSDDLTETNATTITNKGNNIKIKNIDEELTLNYGYVDKTSITQVNAFLTQCRATFSKYDFNPTFNYDNSGNKTELLNITVTGKIYSPSLDCKIEYWTSVINNVKYNNNNLVGVLSGKSYQLNPEMNELSVVNDRETLKLFNQVTFMSDNSKVCGKTNHKWTLTNTTTSRIIKKKANYFTHFFNQRGEYNLTLTLDDSNGNTITRTKYGILNII